MSESFTIGIADPVTGLVGSWHEKAEELRLAFSERSRCFGIGRSYEKFVWRETDPGTGVGIWEWQDGDGTSADVLVAGTNLQATAFWYQMQYEIQYSWCHSVSDPLFDWGAAEAPKLSSYYGIGDSWKEFCKLVGDTLYVSDTDYGWPRSSEKDVNGEFVMERGGHQTGDYIGLWMIAALVAAFGTFEYWMPGVGGTKGKRTSYEITGGITPDRESSFLNLWGYLQANPSDFETLNLPPYDVGIRTFSLGTTAVESIFITVNAGTVTMDGLDNPFFETWWEWTRSYKRLGGGWQAGVLEGERALDYVYSVPALPLPTPVFHTEVDNRKERYPIMKYNFTNGPI